MIRAEPQLVEAARSGDAAAVERLLVVCQPDLRRFARRACSSAEDAEDAVQIALWQLYRKIGAAGRRDFRHLDVPHYRKGMLSPVPRSEQAAGAG
jgi:DNA-directed RNA polymerase specialized sigma24 family protein